MNDSDEKLEDSDEDGADEEIVELMKNHSLDVDDAKKVQEIMDDYGLDESDAEVKFTDYNFLIKQINDF